MGQSLKNFKVIITGGTGNLGAEVIREFTKNGAVVMVNFRGQDKYDNLKKRCGDSELLFGYSADLTREEEVKAFFRNFEARFRRLDVFIHIMGGFWMGGDLWETPYEKWKFMQELNLNSAFLCCREAFRLMKAQCSGKIFTVSSKSALEHPPHMGAYVVSKAGVLALTGVLANEGKAHNIQVNSILPSVIDTSENRDAMPGADVSTWVKPKEIAQLLIHLCQAGASALSHTNLQVWGRL